MFQKVGLKAMLAAATYRDGCVRSMTPGNSQGLEDLKYGAIACEQEKAKESTSTGSRNRRERERGRKKWIGKGPELESRSCLVSRVANR